MMNHIYRRHERVQHADRERRPTREGLGQVELSVGIIVVILVLKELHFHIYFIFCVVVLNVKEM